MITEASHSSGGEGSPFAPRHETLFATAGQDLKVLSCSFGDVPVPELLDVVPVPVSASATVSHEARAKGRGGPGLQKTLF